MAASAVRCSLPHPSVKRPESAVSPKLRGVVAGRPAARQRCSPLFAASRPGGGVLDRPTTSRPDVDKKGDTQKKKPRIYRVMLHNDTFNKREYVVAVLLRIVKSITVDDAVNVMQEAHQNGLACVIACAQEEAETYCEGLRGNGLIASIEPDGSGGGDSS